MDIQGKLQNVISQYNEINRQVGEAEAQTAGLKEKCHQLLGQAQLLQELQSEQQGEVTTVPSTSEEPVADEPRSE